MVPAAQARVGIMTPPDSLPLTMIGMRPKSVFSFAVTQPVERAHKCIQVACSRRCEDRASASRHAVCWAAARHEGGVHASRQASS